MPKRQRQLNFLLVIHCSHLPKVGLVILSTLRFSCKIGITENVETQQIVSTSGLELDLKKLENLKLD